MPDDQKFLLDIQSDTADVRFAAWRRASEMPPAAIRELGKLAASPKPGIAKAAREAMSTMAHAVGKEVDAPNRAAVVSALLEVAGPNYTLAVRAHSLRLLSGIAGEGSVPAIAKWIHDPDLREEAAYCLERITGEASNKALMAAYKDAKDDFKPRILAALGHRRAGDAMPLAVEAMRSANNDLAVAGAKAFGRIGRKPAGAFQPPNEGDLGSWQRVDLIDSLLRYADAQGKDGNAAEAMRIYKTALERPEEHWQCAAIIGIAKLRSPDAAVAIYSKLKSANRTVRITAEKAWKGMA